MGKPENFENEYFVVDKNSRASVYNDSLKKRKGFSPTLTHQEHKEAEDREALAEIQRDREFIEKKYDVKLRILTQEETLETSGGKYIMSPELDLKELVERLSDLKEQLIKLPPSFFKKLEIKQIVLARKYIEIDMDTGKKRELTGGIHGKIIYIVGGSAVHHEIFHVIDFLMGGRETMGDQSWEEFYQAHDKNVAWQELDPSDNPRGKEMDFYDEEQAHYCNILFNLDDSYYGKFYRKFKTNPAKIEQMKKWLFEFSDGKLNEQYWRDLKDHKVDEHYWGGK